MAEAASRGPVSSAGSQAWPATAPGRPDAPCLPRTDWPLSPPKMASFTRRRAWGSPCDEAGDGLGSRVCGA